MKRKWLKIILISLIIIFIFLILWFGLIYPNRFFRKQEKLLESAGKRYFEVNKTHIPKQDGRVSSVSLETLLKQKYTDNLLIPYSEKLCDIHNSSVRVVNKKGKSEYYTYLKCGQYESSTDHQGPTITLNGKSKITLNKGDTYQEEGVKKVVDNVDGKMDVSKVSISGSVDTSKVGIYQIRYQVSDYLNNKTEVIRTVEVQQSLAQTVKEVTPSGRYVGMATNNYVMFNHMLFRIVNVNEDNTIKIVSDDPLANVDYGSNDGNFAGSSVDKWLNDYFYSLLEKKYRNMIVPTTWCDDTISEQEIAKTECSSTSKKRNIGMLSVQDYNLSFQDFRSYLELSNLVWYTNNVDKDNYYAVASSITVPMKKNYLLNVRPALTLKSDTKILSGDGTQENPYILIKDTIGQKTEFINTRDTGEYISYSGYLFRIIQTMEDQTTEIMMTSVLQNNGQEIAIGYHDEGTRKVYNPKVNGNIGHEITYNMTKYIKTNLFAQREIKVPIYNGDITYLGKKETKKYKVRISSPSTFDMFSAKGKVSSSSGYWCIDSSKRENTKVVVNPIGTTYFDYVDTDDYIERSVKVKAYLLDDVMITGGQGTLASPYTISR